MDAKATGTGEIFIDLNMKYIHMIENNILDTVIQKRVVELQQFIILLCFIAVLFSTSGVHTPM